MKKCLVSLVRLTPDPLRSEHINLGVILQDTEGSYEIVLPDNVNRTKVTRWYSSLDGVLINEFIRELKSSATSQLAESDLHSFAEQRQLGLITVTTPKTVGMTGDLEALRDKMAERLLDLRPNSGGSGVRSVGAVRNRVIKVFEREGLLDTKIEQSPKPIQPTPHALPALMDFHWLNGTDQYVKVYSADKPASASAQSVVNAWDAGKALVLDCETVLEGNKGVSVVLQPARAQVHGLAAVADTIRLRLEKIDVAVYDPGDLEGLVEKVRSGRELTRASA
jgi:hypothetical protein